MRWSRYKDATGVSGAELLAQLKECMDEGMRRDHHRQYSGVDDTTEKDLLQQIHNVVVQKRNQAVTRKNLHKLKQQLGEPIRKFAGRLRSLAVISEYEVKCICKKKVFYSNLVIKGPGDSRNLQYRDQGGGALPLRRKFNDTG